jgi:hypothetical protein
MKKLFLLLFVILFSYSGKSQIKLDSALVAKYYFNGNANDESGNGNNGTISHATLTTDRFNKPNKAYFLDGTSKLSYIDIGKLKGLENQGSISISFWIYKYYDGRYEGFIGKWNSTPYTQENTFLINNGLINYEDKGAFLVNFSDNTGLYIRGLSNLTKNKWTHIVCIFDNSNGKISIFKDGILDNSIIDSNFKGKKLKYHESYTAKIGNFGNLLSGNTYDYIGKIDDIRIYKRPISLSEVDSLFKENNTTSIENLTFDSNLMEIYPNLTSQFLKVLLIKSSYVQIINSNGKCVMETNFKEGENTIELNDFCSGLYFVKCKNETSFDVKKFIKL